MMRNMFHASRWAEVSSIYYLLSWHGFHHHLHPVRRRRKWKTSILWNIWRCLSYRCHCGFQNLRKRHSRIKFLAGLWFCYYSFFCVAVSDPSDRLPLGDRAALGPRIAIRCVLLLGLGYMATTMIIMTLKKYGSLPGSTRTSPFLGIGDRNAMQGLGGGTTAVGNTTQDDHEAATSTGKKVSARDIDARIQREKSISTYSYSTKAGRCGTKTTRKAIWWCWR